MTDPRVNEVSTLPLGSVQERPMVCLPSFPSKEVLEVVGRAALLFAQLEYYLIVIYKRALPGASLPDIIEQRGTDSLGGLLNGVTNRGENNFKGLIKTAEEDNAMLRSVLPQLRNAADLIKIRKKYVHRGIGRRKSDSRWVFLNTAEETSEANIVKELERTGAAFFDTTTIGQRMGVAVHTLDTSVQYVPEPETSWLLLGGLATLVVWRERRKLLPL